MQHNGNMHDAGQLFWRTQFGAKEYQMLELLSLRKGTTITKEKFAIAARFRHFDLIEHHIAPSRRHRAKRELSRTASRKRGL